MKQVVVKSLNEVGRDALFTCYEEEKRELLKVRNKMHLMAFNKIWKREFLENHALREAKYTLTQNPDSERFVHIDLKKIVSEIDLAMMRNGAMKGIDYFVEVFS